MNEIPEPIVQFISIFLEAALPLLMVALVGWLTPKAVAAWRNLKSDRPDVAAVLEAAAGIAVKAAEQANLAGYIDDKKAFAVKYIQDLLAAQGLSGINVAAIEGAVEAAVWEYLNQYLSPEELAAKKAAASLAPPK